MKKQDLYLNIILILLGFVALFYIIPVWCIEPEEPDAMKSSTLPAISCWIIVLLSAWRIIYSFIKGAINVPVITKDTVIHLTAYFLPMCLLLILWKFAGFIAGSIIGLFLLLITAGRRDFKLIIPVSIIVPFVMYGILWYGMHIPLP